MTNRDGDPLRKSEGVPVVLPAIGDEVVCLGGEPVGRVVAVYDSMFKVKTQSDFRLLALEAVYTRSMGRSTLVCNYSGLAHYLLDTTPA